LSKTKKQKQNKHILKVGYLGTTSPFASTCFVLTTATHWFAGVK